MTKQAIQQLIERAQQNPKDVRFVELTKLCEHFFGKGRQSGTSHCIYKTPWRGDPRVNIQEGKNGKAKFYQVKQVLIAIKKIMGMNHGKS